MDESQDKDDDYCPACAGTGEGQYDGTRCQYCKGKGILTNRKENDDEN